MKYSVNYIREMFVSFFTTRGHHYLDPVSVVPQSDKSLLWINSGVATLKSYFNGEATPVHHSLVNTQPSLRTTDLEQIALTNRHLTVFTMLGHFSIGAYWKKIALSYAYEFLTSPQYLNLLKSKLFVTVYEKDDVAYDILINHLQIKKFHIVKTSKKLNFWDMGVGPCGPNVEFYYDLGEQYDLKHAGLAILKYSYESDRYLEIWNCVFSEFNHIQPGIYEPLPRKNIDTGAGLERLAVLLQKTKNIYEIDIFLTAINWLKQNISVEVVALLDQSEIDKKIYIINDHIRAASLTLYYNVLPGGNERNYVVRRLLRRAFLQFHLLKLDVSCISELVKRLAVSFAFINVNFDLTVPGITTNIITEYHLFLAAIKNSLLYLDNLLKNKNTISASEAFYLYETYGIPLDIINEIYPHKTAFAIEEYQQKIKDHQEISRVNVKFTNALKNQSCLIKHLQSPTKFVGYEKTTCSSRVIYLLDDKGNLIPFSNKDLKYAIFESTPFYAQGGGQIYDTGMIFNDDFRAKVVSVEKLFNNHYFHELECLTGSLKNGDVATLKIDEKRRAKVARLHTATHLLNSAINAILANKKYEIKQLGSAIFSKYMRFDFGYSKKLDWNVIIKISQLVNQAILKAIPAKVFVTDLGTAKTLNACMLDEDKYADQVRIVQYNDFSMELCVGTHVANLAKIEKFLIYDFKTKGKGVYRILSLAGNEACQLFFDNKKSAALRKLTELLEKLDSQPPQIIDMVTKINNFVLTDEISLLNLEKSITKICLEINLLLQAQVISSKEQKIKQLVTDIPHHEFDLLTIAKKIVVYCVSDLDNHSARALVDKLIMKYQDTLIALFVKNKSQFLTFLAMNKKSNLNLSCKTLFAKFNQLIHGKGGGHDFFVQGCAPLAANLNDFTILKDVFAQF